MIVGLSSSNRTNLELKQIGTILVDQEGWTSNRTNLELKHNYGASNWVAGHPSNRTNLELKRVEVAAGRA